MNGIRPYLSPDDSGDRPPPHEPAPMEQTKAIAKVVESVADMAGLEIDRVGAILSRQCVNCGTQFSPGVMAEWKEIDRREFGISGLCPTCWDKIFPPEE